MYNMDYKKLLIEYAALCNEKYGRYKSWCWCHYAFEQEINLLRDNPKMKTSEQTKDKLTLLLAFYLASWGMYRGSSFMLRHDYKIHYGIVELVLERDYCELLNASPEVFVDDTLFKNKINLLYDKINKHFHRILPNENLNNQISIILITKIIIGTLGCTPAIDRFFDETRKHELRGRGTIITKNRRLGDIMSDIGVYWKNNQTKIKAAVDSIINFHKSTGIPDFTYPNAKILDMIFWQEGFRKSLALSVLKKSKEKLSDKQRSCLDKFLLNENNSKIYLNIFNGEKKISDKGFTQNKNNHPDLIQNLDETLSLLADFLIKDNAFDNDDEI